MSKLKQQMIKLKRRNNLDVKDWLGKDNKIGIDIWSQKYEYENEGFESWLDRISNGDSEIRQRIIEKKFLFGGRILSNRGLQKLGKKVTLSNCFNMGFVNDDLESIFQTASDMARTYSAGGGCGINLGKLRPNNSIVHNNAKTSTGVIPFMDLYSKVTETICQAGRRGALMICLPIDHPDIEEFISCKENMDKVVKANISVIITDEFMDAVKNDSFFDLRFKVEQTGEEILKIVRAKDLFHQIAEQAWNNAEPGILFKNRIDEYNLMSNVEEYEITGVNPCGW